MDRPRNPEVVIYNLPGSLVEMTVETSQVPRVGDDVKFEGNPYVVSGVVWYVSARRGDMGFYHVPTVFLREPSAVNRSERAWKENAQDPDWNERQRRENRKR